MPTSIWFWIAFHVGVFVAIAIDLASFKRRHRALSMRAAALRSLLWVLLSLGFSLIVSKMLGPDRALDFLTGYLIEYSLSVDNIFVFVLIFQYFRVPPIAQHRVLVWGIIATLAMNAIMFSSQNFGWSRLNLPLLLGTFFTDDRKSANTLGFFLYFIVGWLIAFFYYLFFDLVGHAAWWTGHSRRVLVHM